MPSAPFCISTVEALRARRREIAALADACMITEADVAELLAIGDEIERQFQLAHAGISAADDAGRRAQRERLLERAGPAWEPAFLEAFLARHTFLCTDEARVEAVS